MNILIADDHSLLRELLATVLEANFPGCHIDQASDLAMVQDHLDRGGLYDILLIDLQMPGMEGVASAASIAKRAPNGRTIVVTGNDSPDVALDALRRGVNGYVPKSLGVDATVNAVKLVLSGETYVPSLVLHGMACAEDGLRDVSNDAKCQADSTLKDLTDRELAILLAISKGLPNKQIARKFDVAEITVKVHAQSIFRKLGVQNRTQAAAVYLSTQKQKQKQELVVVA